MSLEKFFADRDVLHGHQPLPWLVLADRVNEERRIAVVETIENVRLRATRDGGQARSCVVHWPGGFVGAGGLVVAGATAAGGLGAAGLAMSSFLITSPEISSDASAHTR